MSVYVQKTTFYKMSENIKVLGSPNRSNIGLINNKVLVDSGQNEEHITILNDYFDTKNVDFTILTHFHHDHTLGLAYLNCIGIAQKNMIQNLLDYKALDHSDEGIKKQIKEGKIPSGMLEWYTREYPDRSKLQVTLPTITYKESMDINFGNCVVELTHIDCDHTNDATIVYVPSEEALFLGDCLSPSNKSTISIPTFRKMLEYLLAFDSNIMVEGHGPPLGNREGNNYLGDLVTIIDYVETKGKESIDQIDTIMIKMKIFDKDSVAVYLPFFIKGL